MSKILTNCTVVDGTGARPRAAAAVHVEADRIIALGSADEVVRRSPGEVAIVSKKTTSRPWALDGGQEPEPNTLIAYLSAGGGGRGDPRTREPERVREGVLDGFDSEQAAREVYGVDPATWTRTSTRAGS